MIIVPDEIVDGDGHFDLAIGQSIGISGLNTYYSFKKINRFPYAYPDDVKEIISTPKE